MSQKNKTKRVTEAFSTNKSLFGAKQRAFQTAPVSDKIANLCEYQCPQCNKVYSRRTSFHKHLGKSQHASMSTSGSFIKFMNIIVVHACHICLKKIQCETEVIKSHLKACHSNLSFKSYCDKFNLKVETETKSSKIRNYIKGYHVKQRQTDSTISNFVVNLCQFNCMICDYACPSWRLMQPIY